VSDRTFLGSFSLTTPVWIIPPFGEFPAPVTGAFNCDRRRSRIAATREALIRKYVTPRLRFSCFGGCDARAIVRRDRLHVP